MSSQSEETIASTPSRKVSAERCEDEILTVPMPVAESAPRSSGLFANVDGGLRGWSAVLGAWLFQFSMVGAISAFGSYQTFYEDQWLKVSGSYEAKRAIRVSSQRPRLVDVLGIIHFMDRKPSALSRVFVSIDQQCIKYCRGFDR